MGLGIRYRVVQTDSGDCIEEIHKIVVHKFTIAETDDPEIYAAEPIWEWQKTDAGKFVMENAITTPAFHRTISHVTLNYEYAIIAELEKKKYSEFLLRFGKTWK